MKQALQQGFPCRSRWLLHFSGLKELLAFSGTDPECVSYKHVSSAEAAEYMEDISAFVESIIKFGTNPLIPKTRVGRKKDKRW